MAKESRVRPALVKGMRDLLPETLLGRAWMVERIRNVYERFGFQPFETPVIEHLETLVGSGAGENAKRIFSWKFEEEDVELALRFDLTVPLARYVAMHKDAARPIKRYQLGPVFRVDKPGAGRYREFTQFDIDTIGTKSLLADAEVIAALHAALAALEPGPFTLTWNHRRLLDALLAAAGVAESQRVPVIRVIDKLEKIGVRGVREELGPGRADDESGAKIPGLSVPPQTIDRVLEILSPGADRAIESALASVPAGGEALAEVEELTTHLAAMGLPPRAVELDPRLARGMDYYTGPVFEARLTDAPEFGSIAGGGRYDDLVSRFSEESVSGTGASIGIDRLLAALQHLGRIAPRRSVTDVLVTVMDKELLVRCVQLAADLRASGFNAEVYLDPSHKLKKQLAYADARAIPAAILLGSDEVAKEQVTVKDLRAGAASASAHGDRASYLGARAGQATIPAASLTEHLRSLLGRNA